jgi:hypothetical protein
MGRHATWVAEKVDWAFAIFYYFVVVNGSLVDS